MLASGLTSKREIADALGVNSPEIDLIKSALEQREYKDLKDLYDDFPDFFTEEMKERYDALNSKYGTGVLINMIRKIIPSMIAADIVGIQPMSAPTGSGLTVKPRYSKSDKI